MSKETATSAAGEDAETASMSLDEGAPPGAEAEAGSRDEVPQDGLPTEPADLQGALDAAERALAAKSDEVLRLKAEMENVRRRSTREVENAHKYGVERLVGELLPVKDSMELGLQAASEEGVEVASVREGLDLTLKMLVAALEKVGVEVVDPQGEAFNPEFHQAMSIQPTEDAEPDSVLTVFQKGYLLSGRLVRPAMVVVAKAP